MGGVRKRERENLRRRRSWATKIFGAFEIRRMTGGEE